MVCGLLYSYFIFPVLYHPSPKHRNIPHTHRLYQHPKRPERPQILVISMNLFRTVTKRYNSAGFAGRVVSHFYTHTKDVLSTLHNRLRCLVNLG